ncbi:PREDICTED: psychosine receptor [Lepidothrix coronata]|uniref:Psychosine receptor n=1 Tax=Lepidothrix coronata TaxID=321398 RepID=A0A6J0H4N1_9PASS|nr:PREDICTED: psychosine receptor [Lepidothrix coronata]XP_017669303.1 PREDICTED: psychosine receptor [Lepidothrix coronata]XP_017669304.1 PREDICTED: psychosine receptor [Lepidothrix coronata]
MNNSTAECHDEHTLDKYLFPFVYSVVMMISVPINCISLYSSCIQVRKKNESAVYIFSLSLADLLYSLILPLWINYAWNGDDWRLSASLCQVSAFLMYMNFYTSTAFLACISVDRYLALVHPLKLQHLRTTRFSLIVSVTVWLLESILNSVILVYKEVFSDPCNFTNHTLCYDTYPLEGWQARINLFRICSGYLVPLIIIVFCYHKIYQVVKCNQATLDEEKKKVRKLILNITVSFIVCFTPYHIILLIRSIREPSTTDPHLLLLMYKVYRITQALTSLNCIADPILYCFMSETAQTHILNVLRCCLCLRKREEDRVKDHALCSSATKSSALITYRTSCEMEMSKKPE